jgi:hypothetical protein
LTSTLVGAVPGLVVMSNSIAAIEHRNRVRGRYDVRIPTADGPVVIADTRMKEILLTPDRANGWRLAIPIGGRRFGGARLPSQIERVSLTGEEAVRAAGLALARMNRSGASRRTVGDAVAFLQQTGAPTEAFTAAAGMPRTWLRYQIGERSLLALPRAVRLGLEMAAHEESERRALEGELAALEQAWKEAEQIAGIADDLLIPESVTRFVRRWRTSSDRRREP